MPRTTPFGVRLPAETREALARAAKDDHRSMASLTEKIISDWLKEHGYAPEPPKAVRGGRPRKPKVQAMEARAGT
ncbi:MAG: CopG-like 1 or ribbon-helix-helix domain, 5 [Geminicoccaceae bacterium]|jgi:hypothetical protein|nr:CopG-like 1 or ribbon-helix-helix domain, 5 [Geminicoccaceae bacterium]